MRATRCKGPPPRMQGKFLDSRGGECVRCDARVLLCNVPFKWGGGRKEGVEETRVLLETCAYLY